MPCHSAGFDVAKKDKKLVATNRRWKEAREDFTQNLRWACACQPPNFWAYILYKDDRISLPYLSPLGCGASFQEP